MGRFRTALLAILVVALAIGAGVWFFRGRIAVAAISRIYAHALARDPYEGLPDGLHVALCGAGSPMPDPGRAGPCVAVLAGHRLFVVDAGAGGVRNMTLMNLPPGNLEAAFLTHLHSDHIDGLGELMLQHWASGAAKTPLPIYGTEGADRVVNGFMAAYEVDRGYRIAHHGPKVVPPSGFGGTAHVFTAPRGAPDLTLIDDPDLKVTAFPVEHHPVEGAVGYKFVYKGRTAVISGDTAASPRLEAAARGADLLVHEGLAPNLVAIQREAAAKSGHDNLAAILHDILSYHAAPETVAAEAQRAQVRYLLFDHIIPPLPSRALEGPWLGRTREIYKGPVRVGRDGDMISLPAGSRDIRYSDRLSFIR